MVDVRAMWLTNNSPTSEIYYVSWDLVNIVNILIFRCFCRKLWDFQILLVFIFGDPYCPEIDPGRPENTKRGLQTSYSYRCIRMSTVRLYENVRVDEKGRFLYDSENGKFRGQRGYFEVIIFSFGKSYQYRFFAGFLAKICHFWQILTAESVILKSVKFARFWNQNLHILICQIL